MRKIIIFLLLIPIVINAQVLPTSKLLWDQGANTLTEAQSLIYRYYPDNSTSGIVLTGVTCIGNTSPYACQVNFPPFAIGNHTLQLTAGNATTESPRSVSLPFSYESVPQVLAPPSNLRFVR